jgi:flavin-dependent dehydrogenase
VDVPIMLLPRKRFDRLLRDFMRSHGGTVLYNTRIYDVAVAPTHVAITDQRGNQFRGDAVVLATGSSTTPASKLGFMSSRPTGVAVRSYVPNSNNLARCHFWMTKSRRPAYSWAFPNPDRQINVGLGYYLDSVVRNPPPSPPRIRAN